jgi:hypothetical protein
MNVTMCDLEGCENTASFNIKVIDGMEWQAYEFDACTMEDAAEHWASINTPEYLASIAP